MNFKIPDPTLCSSITQIPNIFLDDMLVHLGFAEIKIMLVLFRHTFGCLRSKEKTTLLQLQEESGLTRANVAKAIKSLIEKNLIKKVLPSPIEKRKPHYELIVVLERGKRKGGSCEDYISIKT